MNYNKADFGMACGLSGQLPDSDRPEIVFSGRSNVGKSSLINRLCSRKNLARVSSTPGKTATVNFYTVDGVYFVDLPGYGFARISAEERRRWNGLIDGYFGGGRRHALILQLLDSRHEPSADDEMMLEYLRHHQLPFAAVLTKADKLKKNEQLQQLEAFRDFLAPYGCRRVILTSAGDGAGIDELKLCIENALGGADV